MLRSLVLGATAFAAVLGLSLPAQAQFTTGNLAVVRVGDGQTTLANPAFAASVLEYQTNGTFTGFAVSLPSSGATGTGHPGNLTLSGTATSEGILRLSADGFYLTLAGYGAAAGQQGGNGVPFPGGSGAGTAINNTSSAQVNRTIGRIDSTGATSITAVADMYHQNNVRAVVSSNGSEYWTAGTGATLDGNPTNSIRYVLDSATTSTRINDAGPTNARNVGIFGDTLFGSNQLNVFRFTGIPDTGISNPTAIVTATGAEFYGFYFMDLNPNVGDPDANGVDTLYIANGQTATALRKFEWDSATSSWVARGTSALDVMGLPGTGLFDLVAVGEAGNVTIYATSLSASNNGIVSFVDNSGFGGSINNDDFSFSLVAQAGVNYAFRGIDFTPAAIPEPTTLLLGGLGMAGAAYFGRRKLVKQS